MEQEKKKLGRPSQEKEWISFSLDRDIVEYIKFLPAGDRSKIVNNLLARGIAEMKEEIPMKRTTIVQEATKESGTLAKRAEQI